MARIFATLTTHSQDWNDITRIPDKITVPATDWATDDVTKTAIVTPIDNMANSKFPFPWDCPEVYKTGIQQGIDLRGQAYVNRGSRAFRVNDPEWPRSSIGKRRVEQNQNIDDGFISTDEDFQTDGIDGVHMPMRPEGRQEQDRRQTSDNPC